MHLNYSKQKLAAVRKKRRERYWSKKADAAANSPDGQPQEDSGPFPSGAAYRSALKRTKRLIKERGQRLAKIIKGIIHTADTPTKNALSEEKISISSSPLAAEIKDRVSQQLRELSSRRDRESILARRNLAAIFTGNTSQGKENLYSRETNAKKLAVEEFLSQEAIELPAKKDFSKRLNEQKKIMTQTMKAAHSKFSINTNVDVSFRSFCRFKSPNILSVTKTKFRQCLCDICFNPKEKIKSLNFFSQKDLAPVVGDRDTMCAKDDNPFHKIDCILRKCTECGVERWKDSIKEQFCADMKKELTYDRWEYVIDSGKKRMEKVRKKHTTEDVLEELSQELGPLSLHLFNSEWQQSQFNILKKNIHPEHLLLVLDFAENYLCKTQDEAQSAYWSYRQVTVHPVVALFRCNDCNEILTHNFVFLTDDLKHDSHAVNVFYNTCLSHMSLLGFKKVFIFSDGAGSQYKSKIPFFYLTHSPIPAEKVFFGSRHGKNPCDALGGTVKSLCSRLVASSAACINNATSMFQQCTQHSEVSETGSQGCASFHKLRKFFLINSADIDRSCESGLKSVPGTRSIHHVRSLAAGVIATRKLACFCESCLVGDYSCCLNKSHVDNWEVVKMKIDCPELNEGFLDSDNESTCFEEQQEGENSPAKKRISPGSFYLTTWQGKDYVCQVIEIDKTNDVAKIKYMKWRNGKLCWSDDDLSWECLGDIGCEVKLTLNERFSTQRLQLYTYSYIMSS